MDPAEHYLWIGRQLGRKPGPRLSPAARPPAVTGAGISSHSPPWRNNDESQFLLAAYEEIIDRVRSYNNERRQSFKPRPYPMVSLDGADLARHARSLALPQSEIPKVSILIPVYNHVRLTLECLTSLVQNTGTIPYEVIVTDDGSSDATPEILPQVNNLIYRKNSANVGFLRNCNLGAEMARGEFLLILNNDTQLTPGWLDALIRAFEENKNTGLAGPRFVYPAGWLQEAGAAILRDASAVLLGEGGDPSQPRYNYDREVDYCSGACILIKTEFFKKIGGFDQTFAPAYCEDTDLSLQVHQQGLKVIYVHDSVVIHHLSATSNTAGDYKQELAVKNQQKLSEKWQEQIDKFNDVQLIAFYLPQFHPIPENSLWWGKGFTEWTNVAKARPNFAGHLQPRLPADLGFYDLRVVDVMDQQAELARRYGIHGFCYFYYWFGGRRILDMPLERMLAENRPDFPFCLSWANENWTRRWDGQEQDVLLGQQHSNDDDIAVMRDLMRYFRHANYIRINGKPLLLVYRINLFPDIRRTISIWRDLCRKEGIGEIYLAFVESFEQAQAFENPKNYGFDASVEYPPHGMASPVETPGELYNPDYTGTVHDYQDVIMKYLRQDLPPYMRFRGVMPSWDNTPRRQNHAAVFHGANPGAYQAWLQTVIAQTREQNFGDERMVFINAWNEWAEGAYLEPDRLFGHGYLEATKHAREAWLLHK
jgi:GT2 family glycosyltransferase